MRICPFDLERCDRPACDAGVCKMSGESTLTPCAECGGLIALGGLVICIDCATAEAPQETES